MSTETITPVQFEFPQKPVVLTDEEISNTAALWMRQHIKYDAQGTALAVEECIKDGKATCFGQALGAIALFESWELPTGLALSNSPTYHATAMVQAPDSPYLDQTVFFEPIYSGMRKHLNGIEYFTKVNEGGRMLDIVSSVYRHSQAILRGEVSHAMFVKVPEDPTWHISTDTSFKQDKTVAKSSKAFILSNPQLGSDMLEAVSTLYQLREAKDYATYADAYPAFITDVPDFIYFPPPKPGHAV